MKNKKAFLDSNVLIYSYSLDEPQKRKIARELLKKKISISTQVVNELFWVLLRKFHVKSADILLISQSLFQNYEVHQVSQKTIEKAIQIQSRYSLNYWDCLMLASALQSGCTLFISEDMQNGMIIDDTLEIINPFVALNTQSKKPEKTGKA